MVECPLDVGPYFEKFLLDCSEGGGTSFDTPPDFSGEDELYWMIFLIHYPTEDTFCCYVLIKLTNFAAVHCYYELQQVGTFDILAVWICNYARARDDPSLIVET